MAGGITYADLRFARSPPEKSQGEELNEGELTYENLQGLRALEKEAAESGPLKNSPELPCWPTPSHRWRAVTNRPMLVALALCLFLLATNIALGVQYLQASRQLQQTSRDHAAKSHVLGERTHHLQASLEENQNLLHLTEQELNSTKKELNFSTVALWQSQAAENQTRQRLQHQELWVDQANRSLALLQAYLRQATSCRQIGWTLVHWKCLWVSNTWKTWWDSKVDCEGKSSRLLVLKPWSAQEFWQDEVFTQMLGSEDSNFFWIGLLKIQEVDNTWKWVDGSRYEGSEAPSNYYSYAAMDNGRLSTGKPSWQCRFICERAASPEKPPLSDGLRRDF